MTQHPNPADMAEEQIAQVERLFDAFPDARIAKALEQARENVRREQKGETKC